MQTGIKRLSQINMMLCGLFLMLYSLLGHKLHLGWFSSKYRLLHSKLIKPFTSTQGYMDSSWQNGWTLFYYSWWFAWSPFVGLFIARISYGRSIQEFLLGVVLIPSILVFVWMGVFGNAALYQELMDPNSLSTAINNDIAISLFVFLEHFHFSPLLMGLSILIILTFFVTSSDSGALVTSMLTAANNEKAQNEPPMILRVIWAYVIGSYCCCALGRWRLGCIADLCHSYWHAICNSNSLCMQKFAQKP